MTNEIIFLIFFIILWIFNLIAFRFGVVYIFILIAIYTILMNIFVTKQFHLFWLAITWWNALYGAMFLLTDLLSEHHWKKAAYKAVIIGFVSMIIFIIATQFLIAFSPNEYDFANESIVTLFELTPRILAWSLIAYIIAQSIDVYIYDKIRKFTKEKYLFLRNNWSTIISQAIDTIIFTFIWLTSIWPFVWIIEMTIFWQVCLATYMIKLLIAFIDTPFIYLSYYFKKKKTDN